MTRRPRREGGVVFVHHDTRGALLQPHSPGGSTGDGCRLKVKNIIQGETIY